MKPHNHYAIEVFCTIRNKWVVMENWWGMSRQKAEGAWMVLDAFYGGPRQKLRMIRDDGLVVETMTTRPEPGPSKMEFINTAMGEVLPEAELSAKEREVYRLAERLRKNCCDLGAFDISFAVAGTKLICMVEKKDAVKFWKERLADIPPGIDYEVKYVGKITPQGDAGNGEKSR